MIVDEPSLPKRGQIHLLDVGGHVRRFQVHPGRKKGLRRSVSEQAFIARIRTITGGGPV